MATQHLGEWIAAESEFSAVCRALSELEPQIGEHLIVHYFRPTDPCVPAQALKMTVAAVRALPFDALRDWPGVGLVKVRNLIALLHRIELETRGLALDPATESETSSEPIVEATSANELDWDRWCAAIRAHYLEDQCLGRVVDRLSDLPRSMWHVRLREYVNRPLEAIRALPAHGSRRVELIVETVRKLSELITAAEAVPGATLTIGPEPIAAADGRLIDAVLGRRSLEGDRLWSEVLSPLVSQVRHDLGDASADVLRSRIAGHCPAAVAPTGDEIAWKDRLSASRLQQLWHDAATAVAVRWPRGADAAAAIVHQAERVADGDAVVPLRNTLAAVFPRLKERSAAQTARS